MTREQVKKLLESGVLQAYVEGKTIQVRHVNGSWLNIGNPNFSGDEYRIKPELVYKPFDFDSAVKAGMHEKTLYYKGVGNYVPYLRYDGFLVNGHFYTWQNSLDFTFRDGTPCGVLEE